VIHTRLICTVQINVTVIVLLFLDQNPLFGNNRPRNSKPHGDAEQYTLVPFAVESHGQLCKEAVVFLHMPAEWGAGSGLQRAGKGAWSMSFYRELSCALQRGTA
jgi:hypothetical protein